MVPLRAARELGERVQVSWQLSTGAVMGPPMRLGEVGGDSRRWGDDLAGSVLLDPPAHERCAARPPPRAWGAEHEEIGASVGGYLHDRPGRTWTMHSGALTLAASSAA